MLSAALQVDSVNVKLGMAQLSSSKMGGNDLSVGRIVLHWKELMLFIQTLDMLPLVSDVTGLCVYIFVYTMHMFSQMTSLSASHSVDSTLASSIIVQDNVTYRLKAFCQPGILVLISTDLSWHWELLEICHGNEQPDRKKVKINDTQPNV